MDVKIPVPEQTRPELDNEGGGSHLSSMGDGGSIAEGVESELEKEEEKEPHDHDPSLEGRALLTVQSGLQPEKERGEPHYIPLSERSFEQDGKPPAETVGCGGAQEAGPAVQTSELMNTVTATPQNDTDNWPALFVDGKTDIHFDDGNLWSFSNEIKGSIENFIGARVNWWPLSARRKVLPDGFSRVRWKCVSVVFFQSGKCLTNNALSKALRKKVVRYYVNSS